MFLLLYLLPTYDVTGYNGTRLNLHLKTMKVEKQITKPWKMLRNIFGKTVKNCRDTVSDPQGKFSDESQLSFAFA